jgi:hypothetical protein
MAPGRQHSSSVAGMIAPPTPTMTATRMLHHVAAMYAPGDRPVAGALLELLGCEVFESGSPFLLARIGPARPGLAESWVFASEVTPEQWRLEETLRAEREGGVLAGPANDYVRRLRADPQHACHFAIRYPSEAEFEATLDRLEHVADHAPTLAGRVSISGLFRPGDRGAQSATQTQAFVYTDVVASSVLAFGQHIELQWEVS